MNNLNEVTISELDTEDIIYDLQASIALLDGVATGNLNESSYFASAVMIITDKLRECLDAIENLTKKEVQENE